MTTPGSGRARIAATVLGLAVGTTAPAACSAEDPAGQAGSGDLVAGDTYTVRGEVQERIGEDAFLLGEEEILVWGADAADVEVGDQVAVTGIVAEFLLPDVEEQLGYDLDDATYAAYENQLTVRAGSVVVADG